MRAWSGWATSANTTSTMPAEGGGGEDGEEMGERKEE